MAAKSAKPQDIKGKDANPIETKPIDISIQKPIENPLLNVEPVQTSPLLKPRQEKGCINHHQRLVFYCESCEEPICEQCTILGPHNNQLHRINTLGEAFKSRVIGIHHVIGGSLLGKRDQLIAQVHRIDHRLEEVKHIKIIIERDLKSELGGILERLRAAEGAKLAVLQHDIANLQKDIEKINDIVNLITDLTHDKADHFELLLRWKHLTDTIEFAMSKPFKTAIDVVPDDLPKELIERKEKLDKMRVVQEILEMKDMVVFELLNKFNEEEDKITASLNKTAQEEMNEWAKLTDRFADELRKYHIICFYCACVLDDRNVNRQCDANNRTQPPAEFGFTVSGPDKQWHGTRRHFFAKPKPEVIKAGKITNAGIPELSYVKINQNDEKLYKAQYEMFLEVLLAKVKKYCSEQKIEIAKLFTDHDKNATVDVIEIDKLKAILDPTNTGKIHYMDMIKLINEPSYLIKFQEGK